MTYDPTLARDLYEVAADDVADDIIGGAANMKTRSTNWHDALRAACDEHLTDHQKGRLEEMGHRLEQ